MVRGLLEKVLQAPLDGSGRTRMREIYESSLRELKDPSSENLQRELKTLSIPLEETPSESEISVAQAQLVGWREGLLHGFQAALWAQHMQAQSQLEELRREALPGGKLERRPKSRMVAYRAASIYSEDSTMAGERIRVGPCPASFRRSPRTPPRSRYEPRRRTWRGLSSPSSPAPRSRRSLPPPGWMSASRGPGRLLASLRRPRLRGQES